MYDFIPPAALDGPEKGWRPPVQPDPAVDDDDPAGRLDELAGRTEGKGQSCTRHWGIS